MTRPQGISASRVVGAEMASQSTLLQAVAAALCARAMEEWQGDPELAGELPAVVRVFIERDDGLFEPHRMLTVTRLRSESTGPAGSDHG